MANGEYGKAILCREITSGRHFPAKFEHSGDGLLTEIYTWSEFYHFEDGQILLEDSNCKFISLHNCLVSKAATYTRGKKCEKHIVQANFAIVGDTPWREDEKFTRISFKVSQALRLFTEGPIEEEFIKKYRNEDYDSTFLTLDLAECKIKFYFEYSFSLVSNRDPEIKDLICELEFKQPLGLNTYYESIWCIISFLSFCLGQPITPTQIHISRSDAKSWHQYLAENTDESPQMSFHQILWLSNSDGSEGITDSFPLYQVTNETERDVFKSALERWIQLISNEWKSAATHMNTSLSFAGNHFNTERVLSAFRWLESAPTFNALKVESEETIQELTTATIKKAQQLKINQNPDRIRQMLSKLKEESFSQQIKRTLSELSQEFSIIKSMTSIEKHLKNARAVRGKAAHDILDWRVKKSIDPYLTVLALEVFCTFLMLKELPRSERVERCAERYILVEHAYYNLIHK